MKRIIHLHRRPFRAVLIAGLALLLLALGRHEAEAAAQGATIYFFRGEGCPHCADAEPVLRDLVRRHPGAELRDFEVWYDEDNAAVFMRMAEAQGFAADAVPTIVIGERHWIGYSESLVPQIEAALEACLERGCIDPGAGIVTVGGGSPSPPIGPGAGEAPLAIELPFVGTIDLTGHALWVSTLLIALVDGFNPCSLWVLSILVALALRTGSRRRVLLIGLTFITVTAGVYALFIAGLFAVLKVVSFIGWVQIAVALMALAFGAINVKDYFFYKEGISLTIDERRKPGLYRDIRSAVDRARSPWSAIAATALLAIGVSIVEFSCTAGFPAIWTNLLTAQEVSALGFAALLLLYLLIYQLDELALFLAAVVTLRAGRIDESHGRVLKLVGGVLMLTLAAVMIIDPALMSDLGSALAIFALALAATAAILVVHRRILPAFGIRIGSDTPASGKRSPR